jgi:hypothetical protein
MTLAVPGCIRSPNSNGARLCVFHPTANVSVLEYGGVELRSTRSYPWQRRVIRFARGIFTSSYLELCFCQTWNYCVLGERNGRFRYVYEWRRVGVARLIVTRFPVQLLASRCPGGGKELSSATQRGLKHEPGNFTSKLHLSFVLHLL